MAKASLPPKAVLDDLVQRWKDGGRIPGLKQHMTEKLGREVSAGTTRFWIIKHLGGNRAYLEAAAVRDEAHPRPKLMPPRRNGGGAVAVIDDSNVPVVTAMLLSKGWKLESLTVAHYRHDVFVSPEGVKYVVAKGNEKAELIGKPKTGGLAPLRLRRLEQSAIERRARRHAKQVKQGEEQRKRRCFEPGDSIRRQQAAHRRARALARRGHGK